MSELLCYSLHISPPHAFKSVVKHIQLLYNLYKSLLRLYKYIQIHTNLYSVSASSILNSVITERLNYLLQIYNLTNMSNYILYIRLMITSLLSIHYFSLNYAGCHQ